MGALIGALFGHLIPDVPKISLDWNTGVIDLVNLLVTIFIALMIPLLLTKFLENQREVKNLIIDEMKELLKLIAEIPGVIHGAQQEGKYTSKDRDAIVRGFHKADLKLNSIIEQVSEAFPKKSKEIISCLKEPYNAYHSFITGGELMTSKFKQVDDRCYMSTNTEYSKVTTCIKTTIQRIYKL